MAKVRISMLRIMLGDSDALIVQEVDCIDMECDVNGDRTGDCEKGGFYVVFEGGRLHSGKIAVRFTVTRGIGFRRAARSLHG
jgi:hypothetical protein